MLIQCTKRLRDEKRFSIEEPKEEHPLYMWHANLIKLGQKKTLVLMNDKTRYVIVLYGVKAKELGHLDRLVPKAIKQTLKAEGINDEVIEKYITYMNEFSYSKTKDRKCVARLNRACEDLKFFEDYLNPDVIIQERVSVRLSSTLVGDGKNSYIKPNEEMYKSLEEMTGLPVFSTEAYQLKVSLKLENHSVWRRLTVPSNFTFSGLHDVLQVAFGWQERHLHDFEVYPDYEKGKNEFGNEETPILRLVSDEEAFDYPGEIPTKREGSVELSECLPAKVIYNYDYGDGWKHEIEVEEVIENKVNHAVCLDGQGNAPPEDVGGEGGYEEFLRVISDSNNEDYQFMMHWAEAQGYEEFKLWEINLRLKH